MAVALRATPEGVVVRVRVAPGASRERIVGALGDALKVATTAAPEKGKANKAVCALLARAFGVASGDATVVAGATSRDKQVLLRGLSEPAVAARLDELIAGG